MSKYNVTADSHFCSFILRKGQKSLSCGTCRLGKEMIWWRGEKGTGAEEPTLSWAFRSNFDTFVCFHFPGMRLSLFYCCCFGCCCFGCCYCWLLSLMILLLWLNLHIIETFWMIKVFCNDHYTDCQVSDPAGKEASGDCSAPFFHLFSLTPFVEQLIYIHMAQLVCKMLFCLSDICCALLDIYVSF